MKATAMLCLVSLAALAIGGCSTSTGPTPIAGPNFNDRTSPENVIRNIVLAYEDMNLTEYLDCLSEDFEFFPDDEDVGNAGGEIPPVWYKTDEAAMHDNMFDEDSDVESISLTLTITSIVIDTGDPGDDLDDTCVCRVDVDLRVNTVMGLTYLATAPSEFCMRIDTDQMGSDGALLWEIEQWYDVGSAPVTRSPVSEDASWGGIKAMYQ